MSSLQVKIPSKLGEVFKGDARYRVAYGGRGSGKSWAFAAMLIVKAMEKKRRILCTRELQKSIKDSSHKLLTDTIDRLGVSPFFEVGESFIRCPHTGSDFIFKGLKYNPDEIKSTEGIDIAWVEEAHRLTKAGDELLVPTVRKEGSEIWYSFNPDDEFDHVYTKFVANDPPPHTKIAEVHFDDNPWFPSVLDEERAFMEENDPETYKHVWQGKCKVTKEGSYYGDVLQWLVENGHVLKIDYDPSKPVDTFWDIGKSDYTAIWFAQVNGNSFNIIDYYQDEGGEPRTHADMLRAKKAKLGYSYGQHVLPHDSKHNRYGMGGRNIKKQIQDLLPDEMIMDLSVTQDIQADINAVRMFLRRCYFDKERTADGWLALKHYRKEWSESRQRYKDKPFHDWASDGADAFRQLVVWYLKRNTIERPKQDDQGIPTFNAMVSGQTQRSKRI